MDERTLKAGTNIFFGAPANPMPEIMATAILRAVGQVPGIREAHLPQCFIEGDNEARQVLVIGVDSKDDIPRVAGQLIGKLKMELGPTQFIDVIPYESRVLPESVRSAGCRVFEQRAR
jgi:SseB protein C-terminal domain